MAGGYQAPSNPAPVSGPGALSQRTDGGPSQPMTQLADPAQYGDQIDAQRAQAAGPMYAQPPIPMPTPLDAPTGRPNEPVTEGVPVGAGSNALTQEGQTVFTEDMAKIAKYLPQFESMAAQEETPESFRLFVRNLRGSA